MDFYAEKMAKINKNKFLEARPKAVVITHGCQMNARDSETLAGMLVQMGYDITKEEAGADLVIFNTCCVRENAENKLYGNLGRLKEEKSRRPGMKLLLCGCMMQQDVVVDKIRASYPYVDVIFGTHNISRFPRLLWDHFESGGRIVDIWEQEGEIEEDLPAVRQFPFKASVNIMYGCDNYCTFCIVPYVRGGERSREASDILREIETLAADGVVEVTLLGQNVNSYGKGLGLGFADLLRRVAAVKGLKRIRFMSNHPKDMSDDVIAAMRDLKKVCKHLHLPFQAGSSRVLKQMNRGYTKEDYLALIERVKAAIPGVALTTDIMVGFPGETEEDFGHTLDVVRKGRFAGAFTFLYSKRQGTAAAVMENQVTEEVAKERFNRLLTEVNSITAEISQRKQGHVLEVLVEAVGKDSILNGRADDNTLVHFAGAENLLGKMVPVKITEARAFYLNGEIVDEEF